MKIAIISDIHDNLANLKICLDWCNKEKTETLICCGDITNSDTLNFLAINFRRNIFLVRGNADIYNEEEVGKYKNIKYLGRIGRFEVDDIFIGLCHEPFLADDVIKKGDCDFIFYGHTHRPWEEKDRGFNFVNPGTLGGVFYKASFGVFDTITKELELKILEIL